MSSTDALPLPAIAPPGEVTGDLPCRTCGYNLRTLSTTAICPECATPVANSIRTELLRDADPNWLAFQWLGCRMLNWGISTFWVVIAFSMSLPIRHYLAWVSLPADAIAVTGLWLLTIPDPSGLGEAAYGSLRRQTRALGIIQFATMFTMELATTPSAGVQFALKLVDLLARGFWGSLLIWLLYRFSLRTTANYSKMSLRLRLLEFILLCLPSMALLLARTPLVPAAVPLILAASPLHRYVDFLGYIMLLGAIRRFQKDLRVEIASSPHYKPLSFWRAAGYFLYSARQLFRRDDGNPN